jgi:hypothetical protein
MRVRLEPLIVATAATLTHGCPSTFNCNPPKEQFSVSTTLSEDEVAKMVKDYGLSDRSKITCPAACNVVYARDRGWQTGKLDSCTLNVSPAASTSASAVSSSASPPGAPAPGALVGATISCAGVGYEYLCEGRRPLGHVETDVTDASFAGHLARTAHLEAASVGAFLDLAERLHGFGAPDSLHTRCLAAAEEEQRHTDLATALARSFGSAPPRTERIPRDPTLLEIAIDNAAEGCVREAWAAVRATHLAHSAATEELRAFYGAIATDEAGHAQLAWDVHAWLWRQLDDEGRAEVQRALDAELAALPELAALQARITPLELGGANAEALRGAAARFAGGLRSAAAA